MSPAPPLPTGSAGRWGMDEPRYQQWITENVPSNPLGMCRTICAEMREAFPEELRMIRGHYHDAFWGKRGHWWLITDSGKIIDPTKAQFPDQHGEYEPW